jgi:hypothetical protein
MSVYTAIAAILTANTDINTIVADRIYPLRAAQGKTVPLITVQVNQVDPVDTKDGNEYDWVYVQLTMFSPTYNQCQTLATLCRDALFRYRGTTEGINIHTVVFENQTDGYDNEVQVQQINQSYKLWINQ